MSAAPTKTLEGWRNWWREQSPVRQDRYAMIAPIVTVLLFLTVLFLTIGYLRFEEEQREQESLKRDSDYTHSQLRERLQERKEQVLQMAKDVGRGLVDNAEFLSQAETLVGTSPELLTLVWVDKTRKFRSAYLTTGAYTMDWVKSPVLKADSMALDTYKRVEQTRVPIYSEPYFSADSRGLIQLQAPILGLPDRLTGSRFFGVLVAEISLDGLLQHGVPADIAKKYGAAFIDAERQRMAGQLSPKAGLADGSFAWLTGMGARHEYVSDFELNENERTVIEGDAPLQLVLQGYRTSQGFTGSALRLLVAALSLLTIWMLIANWRHTRRRLRTQDALLAETNFRRAMENSMPTGMRALDMAGRITYVNAAFCQMTQWREADLVGTMPPYVYWPSEDVPKLHETLGQEISGNANPLGVEMQVLRRNGSRFAARMYVSPLVDARGNQTGWMASMTDITEPKRIREELESSYDRFTTILEGLDASISVSSMGSKRLLFANKTYREWFGEESHEQPDFVDTMLAMPGSNEDVDDIDDVDMLAGLPMADVEDAPSERKEIFLSSSDRWLEVRVRYLNWVDGHLAQMVIASDITARRNAENLAAQQAERAQAASRLITMGEMASSVAHELNQPLAAIANYCSGMTSRINNHQIDNDELLSAIEKTAKQAQRAGQIIQRIRSFVTRSAPNRAPSDMGVMVSEAIELVGIEVQRRRVQLTHYIETGLPSVLVDPILIEQVIVNLIKNAAESIDSGGDYSPKDMAKRLIDVRVYSKSLKLNDLIQDGIECSVSDTGQGVPPDVLAKIFDAFFSTKADGMGIGLNLCRSIIESHQGRLHAENLYNGKAADNAISGCRFSFWLPLDSSLISPQPSQPEIPS